MAISDDDPSRQQAWDAAQQGINDFRAGAPFNPPIDLTGDPTTANAYQVGYLWAAGQLPLDDSEPPADWSDETGPTIGPPVENGTPLNDDGLTPQEQRILDFLNDSEDPHDEPPEFEMPKPPEELEPVGVNDSSGFGGYSQAPDYSTQSDDANFAVDTQAPSDRDPMALGQFDPTAPPIG
jgi:hypothetical protein